MDQLLADTVAVVTGGASGIGRQIAFTFAAHGADVVVADVRDSPRGDGDPTHETIEQKWPTRGVYRECDVSKQSDMKDAIVPTRELGGLDIMVNNAGVLHTTSAFEITEEELDETLTVNVKGAFFGTQVAAQEMRATDGGSIINLSSGASMVGVGEYITYSASKGAVTSLTYAFADAMAGEDVRINAVHPGMIDTKMTTEDIPDMNVDAFDALAAGIPSGRLGQPQDVANTVLFLASDLSEFVNATSILVDGGQINTA